jgi:hypothetical protein
MTKTTVTTQTDAMNGVPHLSDTRCPLVVVVLLFPPLTTVVVLALAVVDVAV